MGSMTRVEMETEIRGFLGGRSDLDSRLANILDLSQKRMVRLHNFHELEKLSYEAMSYTADKDVDKFMSLPGSIRKVRTIRLISGTDSRLLTGKSRRAFDKFIPYPQEYATGKPEIYTRWKDVIEFWRIPDEAYRVELRWTKWPALLALSTDTAELENMDDILILLASSWCLLSLGKEDRATKLWQIYRRELKNAIGEDADQEDINITPEGVNTGVISGGGNYWADPFYNG